MSNSNIVPKLYRNVIEEVIKNVKEAFLNEGVDEQVLQELKQIWESKLLQSRAVDSMPADNLQPVRQQYMYPHMVHQSSVMPASITRQQQVPSTHGITVSVPGGITHRQTAGGQTTIVFPEVHAQAQAHAHALSQMTPAASAATLAIQQVPGTSVGVARLPTAYPTARTIQVAHPTQRQQLQPQLQPQRQQLQPQLQPQRQQLQPQLQPQRQQLQPQRQQLQPQRQQLQPQIQHLQTTQMPSDKQHHQGQAETQKSRTNKQPQMIIQVDGVNDSDSDVEDDEDDEDEDDHDKNAGQECGEEGAEEEEEPLNSEDDGSDDGATDLFDTENVVVCQFDKIARSRNKWKFHLKDGIMNLKGRDYVFQKAIGEAEW